MCSGAVKFIFARKIFKEEEIILCYISNFLWKPLKRSLWLSISQSTFSPWTRSNTTRWDTLCQQTYMWTDSADCLVGKRGMKHLFIQYIRGRENFSCIGFNMVRLNWAELNWNGKDGGWNAMLCTFTNIPTFFGT